MGGDYKFLLIVCGLSGATSNYACLYCKVHKDQRWDTSKDLAYYNQLPLARSLHELRNPPKMNYCAVNKPLFDIPLTHIVVDELHLLLRITDVLTRNLVEECLEWDEHETITKGAIAPTRRYHVKELTDTISSCGVTFSVWEKLNGLESMNTLVLWAETRKGYLKDYQKNYPTFSMQRQHQLSKSFGLTSKSCIHF